MISGWGPHSRIFFIEDLRDPHALDVIMPLLIFAGIAGVGLVGCYSTWLVITGLAGAAVVVALSTERPLYLIVVSDDGIGFRTHLCSRFIPWSRIWRAFICVTDEVTSVHLIPSGFVLSGLRFTAPPPNRPKNSCGTSSPIAPT